MGSNIGAKTLALGCLGVMVGNPKLAKKLMKRIYSEEYADPYEAIDRISEEADLLFFENQHKHVHRSGKSGERGGKRKGKGKGKRGNEAGKNPQVEGLASGGGLHMPVSRLGIEELVAPLPWKSVGVIRAGDPLEADRQWRPRG